MPLTSKQQREDRETLIARVVALTLEEGRFATQQYEMSLQGYEIRVTDLWSKKLVAFSSTKADFEQSLVEFADDYFTW